VKDGASGGGERIPQLKETRMQSALLIRRRRRLPQECPKKAGESVGGPVLNDEGTRRKGRLFCAFCFFPVPVGYVILYLFPF